MLLRIGKMVFRLKAEWGAQVMRSSKEGRGRVEGWGVSLVGLEEYEGGRGRRRKGMGD